ncbi:hypothetical protein RAB80_008977 [Fusarium oxysporum f. sp. vasinfectum]|uniref:Uncharacterized protein n=1 Tax=Fusarium oxysporum f. sp. vasinfectum 25433 TaxID=1089449 RepID=X0L5Z2_FUSOX|nr:hypothetical protein FOTG_15318 [Fusarium oxysporum f. sp. vasinfectum 25433]KAK2676791.1 hypothetical protein RAB80_008977 [Fusarium oxysporum f. sp. vasinfectum]KAK2933475.1 hypothetical protein FoTM2_007936 [Fusarium oxysporum f. sp. vasinfectum]
MSTASARTTYKVGIENRLKGSTRVYIEFKDGSMSRDWPYQKRIHDVEIDPTTLKALHVEGATPFPQGIWGRKGKSLFDWPEDKDPNVSKDMNDLNIIEGTSNHDKIVVIEINIPGPFDPSPQPLERIH